MPSLSYNQIAALAKAAGFTGRQVDTAAAIALAESGGDPKSHNATPPDDSYGLWQINMLGAMGPDRRKRFNLKSNTDLFDPATNARVAHGIYLGSGFEAWTTYTRGTYKKFLTGADGNAVTSAASAVTNANPINGVSDAINAFGGTLFKSVANVGGIIVAVVLLIAGVIILQHKNIGKVTKVAAKVLP